MSPQAPALYLLLHYPGLFMIVAPIVAVVGSLWAVSHDRRRDARSAAAR